MIIDILGWIGSVCILLAYILVSVKKVTGNSRLYQLINLIGGLLLAANTYYKGAIPATFLNVFWAVIAVKTLLTK